MKQILHRPLTATQAIIPVPAKVELTDGELNFATLNSVYAPADFLDVAEKIRAMFAFFGKKIFITNSKENASIALRHSLDFPAEAWKMVISPDKIDICGSASGLFYAYTALAQMVCAASSCGADVAKIECAEIEDFPCFSWRGFMLDPARHFQSVATVKKVLNIMAQYRLNIFHWHLSDSQGFRIVGANFPELADLGTLDYGTYSVEEIKEIIDFAKKLRIKIVPEIDVPGHSGGLLKKYPQYACDPTSPGLEYCLSKPEAKKFVKDMLKAEMDLFADSDVIHLGGDEADTDNWDKCPSCQAALKEKGFNNIRQLENDFMREMCQFVLQNGRTPLVWCIGKDSKHSYPPEVMIQAWFVGNVRSILDTKQGNKIVYSPHTFTYFDYPASDAEPAYNWMFPLPAEEVCDTNPYRIWDNQPKEQIAGVEGCLWTEIVPDWRVLPKILCRIGALAESAWSLPENRVQYSLIKRRDVLYFAGYEEFLRQL